MPRCNAGGWISCLTTGGRSKPAHADYSDSISRPGRSAPAAEPAAGTARTLRYSGLGSRVPGTGCARPPPADPAARRPRPVPAARSGVAFDHRTPGVVHYPLEPALDREDHGNSRDLGCAGQSHTGQERYVPSPAAGFAEARPQAEYQRFVRQRPDCDLAASGTGSEGIAENSGDSAPGGPRVAGATRATAIAG